MSIEACVTAATYRLHMRSPLVLTALVLGLTIPTGIFAQFGPETFQFSEGPCSIDLVDIDNDGDVDLLSAGREGAVLRTNTDGEGTWSTPVLIDPQVLIARAVDVNDDGAVDLVAGLQYGGGIRWYPNTGGATFGLPVTLTSAFSTVQLEHADLDGDGDEDLLTLSEAGNIQWSNNDGQGQFGPLTLIAAGAGRSLQANDQDGDGDLDILWSSAIAGQFSLAHNLGGGTFAAPLALANGDIGGAGDLDGDGHADVVSASSAAGMTWQRNMTGNGSLGSPSPIETTFTEFEALLLADLDVDGDQDLLMSDADLDEVAWFENTDGQGAFGPRQVIAVNMSGVSALTAGDVNGDGDAEVFVATAALNRICTYENLAYATGRVLGRVFNDINGDGLFNGTDHGLNGFRVDLVGVGSVFTNHSGMYWMDVPTGNIVVSMASDPLWIPTTPTARMASVANTVVAVHTDFGLVADGYVPSLVPQLASGAMRCNEEVRYWVNVRNAGNRTCDIDVALDLEDLSTLGMTMPAATVQSGVAHWTFQNVQPSHQRSIEVNVLLAGPAHLGQTLHDLLTVSAVVNGVSQGSFFASHDPVLLCAYDPNDKQVMPEGSGTEHWTAMGTELTYTVRFQNTGNTYAQNVELVDQLDADLDPSSLRVLSTSHTLRTTVAPTGEVRFQFPNILLPDSATDLVGSQGYVRFAIHHVSNLAEATELANTASIYFDLNPPIITNTVLNTMTYGTVGVSEQVTMDGELSVHPNPMGQEASLLLGAGFNGRVDLTLSDGMGRLVRSWTAAGGTRTTFDRQGLSTGIYLLRASANGTSRTIRVVIE